MKLATIRALLKKEQFEEALQALDDAIAIDPDNGLFWNFRGDVIQLLNSMDGPPLSESERSYLIALELNPNDLDAIESLAHYYDAVGNNPIQAKKYAAKYLSITQKVSVVMNAISAGAIPTVVKSDQFTSEAIDR